MPEGTLHRPKTLDRHEDDEWYDEVHVFIEERWKESEMSGDEWRFTYVAEFKRKGSVQKTLRTGKLTWLLGQIGSVTNPAPCEDNDDAPKENHEMCAQPGCPAEATIEYRKLKDWCNRCGHDHESTLDKRRRFCEKHKRRGDCGLDDADANYVEAAFRGPDGEWVEVLSDERKTQ